MTIPPLPTPPPVTAAATPAAPPLGGWLHVVLSVALIAALTVLTALGHATAAETVPVMALAGGASLGIASQQTP